MLNEEQKKMFDIMTSGSDNIFLSGRAGTGKTTLINEYIKYATSHKMNVVVCATTGIAAVNIKGVTCHRFFKIPIGFVASKPTYNNNLMNADVIIIDEISMCRVDMFDYIADSIIATNDSRQAKGKEPIKLIVVGDFFQLPPVITTKDKEYMQRFFPQSKNGFAFESKLWDWMDFTPCILTQVVRQDDVTTCKALNMIRAGKKEALKYFNAVTNHNYIEDAIYICGTNKEVCAYNQKKYNEVDSDEHTFTSLVAGQVLDSDKPVEDVVKLKVGCRVMLMCNTEKYKNGQIGTVTNIDDNSGTADVLLDGTNTPVTVVKNTWEIYDYETSGDNGLKKKSIGSFTQIPVRLAYAITIHKSQGQTYEKANINPYCWDAGQLYVCLSRVKSVEGMHLVSKIQDSYLVSSPEVCDFYANLHKNCQNS